MSVKNCQLQPSAAAVLLQTSKLGVVALQSIVFFIFT
jgi:hypothetical protein